MVDLPLPFFERAWMALPGFLAGGVLLALRVGQRRGPVATDLTATGQRSMTC